MNPQRIVPAVCCLVLLTATGLNAAVQDEQQINVWIASVKDRSLASDKRLAAIDELGKAGPKARAAVSALVEALGDPDAMVRSASAFTLGFIGTDAAAVVPALTKTLDDSDKFVRSGAANGLAMFGPQSGTAVPELTRALDDAYAPVRSAAARALGRIGPDARPAASRLLGLLGDSDKFVRAAAALAVGDIGEETDAAVMALCNVRKDEYVHVRMGVALSLGRIRLPSSHKALAEMMATDPDAGVRQQAQRSLNFLQRNTGVPPSPPAVPPVTPPPPPVAPQPAAAGWQEFTPTGGGFTVLVPGKPTETRLQEEVQYELRLPGEKADLKFGYVDPPPASPEVKGKTPEQLVEAFAQEAGPNVKAGQMRLLSEKKLLLAGRAPGREYLLQDIRKGQFVRFRFYVVPGPRIYLLGVSSPTRQAVEGTAAERFFGSFRLTAGGPTPALPRVPAFPSQPIPPDAPIAPPPPPVAPPPVTLPVPPPQPGASSLLAYTTFRDLREGAFTAQIPRGWLAKGGAFRTPNLQVITFRLEATSPDRQITIGLIYNEPALLQPNPGLAALGIREGGFYPDGRGGRIPVRSYAPGARYLTQYVLSKRGLTGLHTGPERQWPALAQALVAVPGFDQVHAGEVAYNFSRNGREYRGGALVVTRIFTSQPSAPSLWHCELLAYFEAPVGREKSAIAAAVRLLDTWRLEPRWATGVDVALKSNIQTTARSGQEIARLISDAYWQRDKTYTGIFRADAEVRRGIVQVRDPRTGQDYTMTRGPQSEYFWIRPNGERLATLENRPPTHDAEPLIIIDVRKQ